MLITIDTLKIYERLKKTNLSDASSREIAEVFKETSESTVSELATRKEIELIIRKEIIVIQKTIEVVRKEIAESKSETIKWVAGMLMAQSAIIATLVKLI